VVLLLASRVARPNVHLHKQQQQQHEPREWLCAAHVLLLLVQVV
jgi:hypothetical protein